MWTPRTLVAKVDRVSDGDTVTGTTSEGTKLCVRLLVIDAPQIPHEAKPSQLVGEEARDYVDLNVNLLLVAMGLAEVYRGAAWQVHCREQNRRNRRD